MKGVEEFDGLLRDVGAQKGVLVCPRGFTDTAKARAEGLQIDLYSPVDTDAHKWQASVTIPALCDFRTAAMSFCFSTTAPAPFRLSEDFYSRCTMFDRDGNPLGTALDNALRKWNEGQYPSEPGAHENLNIFKTLTIWLDNGYEPPLRMRLPADISVSLLVQQQLYVGQLPVPKISGFLDQLSGKVISNAFTVGILDAEEVERTWLKINSEAEAPIEPVIRLIGLIGWVEQ